MFFRFFLIASLFLLMACERTKDLPIFPNAPKKSTVTDSAALKKISQADSIYSMQSQMNSIHAHGKDLAVHAHQDIPKQRRMLKRAAETRKARQASYVQERERRLDRLREMQALKEEEE